MQDSWLPPLPTCPSWLISWQTGALLTAYCCDLQDLHPSVPHLLCPNTHLARMKWQQWVYTARAMLCLIKFPSRVDFQSSVVKALCPCHLWYMAPSPGKFYVKIEKKIKWSFFLLLSLLSWRTFLTPRCYSLKVWGHKALEMSPFMCNCAAWSPTPSRSWMNTKAPFGPHPWLLVFILKRKCR